MSVALTVCPVMTEAPLSCRLPWVGRVVILTALSALAGLSLGSEKPKLSGVRVRAVSSTVVSVALVPAGASATALTTTVNACVLMSPSLRTR